MNKRRITPEQETGDLGEKQLSIHFKECGCCWQPRPLDPDLGEDFIIDIYDDGVSAGLGFYAQVKSSDNLSKYKLKNGDYSYPIEVKDLCHWRDYIPQVVLFLWDAKQKHGYWQPVSEIVKDLDERVADWKNQEKVKVHVPSTNTTAFADLNALRRRLAMAIFPVLAELEPMKLHIDFEFPNTRSGNKNRDAVQRFIDTGKGTAIDARFISKMSMSELYGRKYGGVDINRKGKIVFGDLKSDRIEMLRIDLLSETKRLLHNQPIEVKPVQVGVKNVTLSNEHKPAPFMFRLVVALSGDVTFTFSLNEVKTTVTEALQACKFFDEAEKAHYLRISPLTNKSTWGNLGELDAPLNHKNFIQIKGSYRETLEKLRHVETKTGVAFMLTDGGIGEEDWKEIHRVYQILETGRVRERLSRTQQNLRGPKEPNATQILVHGLLEAHQKGEFISMSGVHEGTYVSILGVEVPLGESRFQVNGKVAEESINVLQEMSAAGDEVNEMSFVLVDGNVVQEYTDWLTTPYTLELPENEEKNDV